MKQLWTSQEWLDAPVYTRIVFVTYALFLAGYFLAPQAPEHYEFYYVLVFAPSLLLWAAVWQTQKGNLLLLLMLAYILYMLLSVFWSPDFDWHQAATVFWHGALVLSFICVSLVMRQQLPDSLEQVLRLLIFVAAAHGIISMLVWYSDHPFPASRMRSVGRLEWEIRAAGVYGLFWILALMHFLRSNGLRRWSYGVAALVLLLTILLSQTRTALLGMLVCGTMLSLRKKNIRILAVLATATLATVLVLPDMWNSIVARGLPYRPPIWETSLSNALPHWLIGTGYLASTEVDTPLGAFQHSHNMFIATFRDGGLPGLALLVAILAVALNRALRLSRVYGNNIHLVLLVYLLIFSLFNPDRLLNRPHEEWLFIWLPLILVAVDYQRLVKPPGPARQGDPGLEDTPTETRTPGA